MISLLRHLKILACHSGAALGDRSPEPEQETLSTIGSALFVAAVVARLGTE